MIDTGSISLDEMMTKAKKLDFGKYGYRINFRDTDDKNNKDGVSIYIESINPNNRFNAAYSELTDNRGWSYYYDEQEGFLGGWMDINPTDLINLIKITNYISSGI